MPGQDPAGGAGALLRGPAGGGGHRADRQLGQAERGEGHQQPHAALHTHNNTLCLIYLYLGCYERAAQR